MRFGNEKRTIEILLKPFVAPQAHGEKELGDVKVWKRLARMDSKLVVLSNELDSEHKKHNRGNGSVWAIQNEKGRRRRIGRQE